MDKLSIKMPVSFHKVDGMMEVNLLEPKNSILRKVKLSTHVGIDPDSLLSPKCNEDKFFK